VAAIDAAGGEVINSREYRLTFDEIFAVLVARNHDEVQAEERVDAKRADAEGGSTATDAREPELREIDGPGADALMALGPADAAAPTADPGAPATDADPTVRQLDSETTGEPRDWAAQTEPLPGAQAPLTAEERLAADERRAIEQLDVEAGIADPTAGRAPSPDGREAAR